MIKSDSISTLFPWKYHSNQTECKPKSKNKMEMRKTKWNGKRIKLNYLQWKIKALLAQIQRHSELTRGIS